MQVEERASSKAWGQSLLGTFRTNPEENPGLHLEQKDQIGRAGAGSGLGWGGNHAGALRTVGMQKQCRALSRKRHDLRVRTKPSSQGIWKG